MSSRLWLTRLLYRFLACLSLSCPFCWRYTIIVLTIIMIHFVAIRRQRSSSPLGGPSLWFLLRYESLLNWDCRSLSIIFNRCGSFARTSQWNIQNQPIYYLGLEMSRTILFEIPFLFSSFHHTLFFLFSALYIQNAIKQLSSYICLLYLWSPLSVAKWSHSAPEPKTLGLKFLGEQGCVVCQSFSS